MHDPLTQAQRSAHMGRIRQHGTGPELIVRRLLRQLGVGFRLRCRLPGSPDIVLPQVKTVIFVHGCFWHRHPGCAMASTPSTRRTFWAAKFRGNKKRDAIKASQLRAAGWRVVTVWECQTRSETTLSRWLAGVLKRHTRPQRAKQERVKRKLLEGLDSGPPIRVTAAYWNKLRRRVARKAAGK